MQRITSSSISAKFVLMFLLLASLAATAVSEEVSEKGVKCTEFDASEISTHNNNGHVTYLHQHTVSASDGTRTRCSKAIPPLKICSLAMLSGGGEKAICSVHPAKRIMDNGRWLLTMQQDSRSASELSCAMICN